MARQQVFENWPGGVVTTMRADALPPTASPRGRNSLLSFQAGGQAIVTKRPGFEVMNPTPVSGNGAVIGQMEYTHHVAGVVVKTHVLVTNDGKLSQLSGETVSALDAGEPSPFTAGDLYPQFAVFNDLLFITNGTDQFKVNNDTVQELGIVRPAAPTVADSGVAGTPSGTYDFAISYFNSTTGHESSRSDYNSVAVVGKKINVSWAAPTDAQVDFVFVHVRKTSLNSEFFRLIVGVTPGVDATYGGFAVATTSTVVNVSDAQITALTILSPDTAENEPPPDGLLSFAVHKSRLFALDQNNLYYSKVSLPEAFDPDAFEPVNPQDGQQNVAIGSFFKQLVIFKTGSIHILSGEDPNSWILDEYEPKIGCLSASSIRYHRGYLYWWSHLGPVRWDGSNAPELIGQDLIAPAVTREVLNYARADQIVTEVDEHLDTVLFAVPESGEERNTLILPFSAKGSVWHSDGWNPFDVASMTVVRDSLDRPYVVIGNYSGRLYRFGTKYTDGARVDNGGTTQFTVSGTLTAGSATTVTDSGATFDTTGSGLKDLYLYLVSASGAVQRRRIASNTGTTITPVSAWEATPDMTYGYAIGAAHFEWDTRWELNEAPFHKKRGLKLFSHVLSDSGSARIQVDIFRNYDAYTSIKNFTIAASGVGGIFDVSLFDEAIFGEVEITYSRRRVGKTFQVHRERYSNVETNVQVGLYRSAMSVNLLSEKT